MFLCNSLASFEDQCEPLVQRIKAELERLINTGNRILSYDGQELRLRGVLATGGGSLIPAVRRAAEEVASAHPGCILLVAGEHAQTLVARGAAVYGRSLYATAGSSDSIGITRRTLTAFTIARQAITYMLDSAEEAEYFTKTDADSHDAAVLLLCVRGGLDSNCDVGEQFKHRATVRRSILLPRRTRIGEFFPSDPNRADVFSGRCLVLHNSTNVSAGDVLVSLKVSEGNSLVTAPPSLGELNINAEEEHVKYYGSPEGIIAKKTVYFLLSSRMMGDSTIQIRFLCLDKPSIKLYKDLQKLEPGTFIYKLTGTNDL